MDQKSNIGIALKNIHTSYVLDYKLKNEMTKEIVASDYLYDHNETSMFCHLSGLSLFESSHLPHYFESSRFK